jgi:hypothetical protein
MRSFTRSSAFTRPNDTNAYNSGDLVANSTTAASVTALSWLVGRSDANVALIRRVKISKSGTTATNGSFLVHFYATSPVATAPTNGDNGAWVTIEAGYLGSIAVTVLAHTASCSGWGAAAVNAEIKVPISGGDTTVYGLVTATAAYTPAAQEVFTITPEFEIV